MAPFGRQVVIGSFLVGAAVGAGGCYIWVQRTRPGAVQGQVVQKHDAIDLGGLPQTEALRFKQGFIASFDYRTRNPKWVLEHITAESANGPADRKGNEFFEDKDIEPWLRNKLSDFRGSGYDRGHMAPAMDFKGSQTAMDESFSLVNISPQVGEGFNRDYWARLEKFVKDSTKAFEDVYVLTGPLWMPSLKEGGKWRMEYPLIGEPPSLVSVPTHYFKVVLGKRLRPGAPVQATGGPHPDVAAAAFVLPNAPIDAATPLSAFVVPLEPLEAVAGARFFPGYLSRERMTVLDEQAQDVRAAGLLGMKVFERQALLDSMHPRLALPAGSSAGAAQSGDEAAITRLAPASPAPGQPAPRVPPRTVRGCAHLCEVLACKLPAERFWERGEGRSGSSGPRNSGGNTRALTRR